MQKDKELSIYVVSFLVGFLVCFLISLATGKKEAWDSGLYCMAGIPGMSVPMFFIGRHNPTRAWRWPLTMAVGQSAAMAFAGGSLSLWPLAVIAMVIYSIPQFAAAQIGAAIGKRKG